MKDNLRKITQKLEVIIDARITADPSAPLRTKALKTLRKKTKKHCEMLKTVHTMAISFNTLKGYPWCCNCE